jgi:hypothetical protein
MADVASVCQPSTLRMLIWPQASSAQNNMAAVSADGSTVWVLILRLNSSYSRLIAFVVRTLSHWLGGRRVKVKSRSPASSKLPATARASHRRWRHGPRERDCRRLGSRAGAEEPSSASGGLKHRAVGVRCRRFGGAARAPKPYGFGQLHNPHNRMPPKYTAAAVSSRGGRGLAQSQKSLSQMMCCGGATTLSLRSIS